MKIVLKNVIKIIAFLVTIAVIAIVIKGSGEKSYASEQPEPEPKPTVVSFLTEKGIAFSEASVNDGLLTVKLCSGGDHSTYQDIKSTYEIYEAIHMHTFFEEVHDVQIEIYSPSGKLISDQRTNDVSIPVNRRNGSEKEGKRLSEKELQNTIITYCSSCFYNIEEMNLTPVSYRREKKLFLKLTKGIKSAYSFSALQSMYDYFDSLYLKNGQISQIEIVVLDEKDQEAVYIAGDFSYGTCIGWMNDKAKKDFAEDHGPRRE